MMCILTRDANGERVRERMGERKRKINNKTSGKRGGGDKKLSGYFRCQLRKRERGRGRERLDWLTQ